MKNVMEINHPVIKHKLGILQDQNTKSEQFRQIVKEISKFLLYEATRNFPLKEKKITTPVADAIVTELDIKVMICPVIRAAIGMIDGMLEVIPDASVGFLGYQRNEITLNPEFFYGKLPNDFKDRLVILIDPMFATGGTAIESVNYLKDRGVNEIIFLSIISAPEAIEKFTDQYPEILIFTAQIDEKLNDKGYIVPGLGDAGDRMYNT